MTKGDVPRDDVDQVPTKAELDKGIDYLEEMLNLK